MYKFIQELAWRDYWQQVWVHMGEKINEDLRQAQRGVAHHQMPLALARGKTGIDAMDEAIQSFYESGYIHNHMRMYMASVACNIGKSHWLMPARWMYYHLLDGDWASNALSWQWVCGANSNKKYLANQDNINQYFYTKQKGTFLDTSYEDLSETSIPEALKSLLTPDLSTSLPTSGPVIFAGDRPTLIYNSYNLDPEWKKGMDANRILLLEPTHFSRYPVSAKSLKFIMDLSKNIPDIQIFTGEFEALWEKAPRPVFFKEHPLNIHYKGTEEPREWMFDVQGFYRSFFAFWKQCKRFL